MPRYDAATMQVAISFHVATTTTAKGATHRSRPPESPAG
jgi:hypothetical protein